MVGNSVKAPQDPTNFVKLKIVLPTQLTTEHSSVQSLTANSSEDGSTPGGHTHGWMVRKFCHSRNFGERLSPNSYFTAVNILSLLLFSFFPDQDLCKLYCFAEGYDFFFALASKVKDGTLCSQDSSNVCIDGLCEVIISKCHAVRQLHGFINA